MSHLCYHSFGDIMINFTWNNVLFDITDIGGGALDWDIKRHAHSKDSYELHFIIGGKGELITDTHKYELAAGDFFVTGPNVYHGQNTDKSDPVRDIFIMLQAVNTDKANAISSAFLATHFYYSNAFDFTTAMLIADEFEAKKVDYKSAVSGLAMKLLTDISRLFIPTTFSEATSPENLNDRRFIIIEQEFLFNPDPSLTELSNKLGICERQTQRLLKKYYGKSFREKKKEGRQLQ